jgi:hypothetical protein
VTIADLMFDLVAIALGIAFVVVGIVDGLPFVIALGVLLAAASVRRVVRHRVPPRRRR